MLLTGCSVITSRALITGPDGVRRPQGPLDYAVSSSTSSLSIIITAVVALNIALVLCSRPPEEDNRVSLVMDIQSAKPTRLL